LTKDNSKITRLFQPLTSEFEGFPGDGIATYDQYMVIYLNKDYGAEILLMNITENFKGIPKIIKAFTFESFIYEFIIFNGVVNFLSNDNVIFQVDLTPYKNIQGPIELINILNEKYLVSTYLYNKKRQIKRLLGRFGENSKQGLAIIGFLMRLSGNTVVGC
jgi:hypothetical protein